MQWVPPGKKAACPWAPAPSQSRSDLGSTSKGTCAPPEPLWSSTSSSKARAEGGWGGVTTCPSSRPGPGPRGPGSAVPARPAGQGLTLSLMRISMGLLPHSMRTSSLAWPGTA